MRQPSSFMNAMKSFMNSFPLADSCRLPLDFRGFAFQEERLPTRPPRRSFGKLPEAAVHLEDLVVESGNHTMEKRRCIVDSGQFPAHVFKEDVGRIRAVHHVHVDFPHAAAGVDGLFEIVQQLDVCGLVQIQ